MTRAVEGDALHVAPARVPYDARDMAVLGMAAVAAAVVAAVARYAVPRVQPLVGLIVIMAVGFAILSQPPAVDRRAPPWGFRLPGVFWLLVFETNPRPRGFPIHGGAPKH